MLKNLVRPLAILAVAATAMAAPQPAGPIYVAKGASVRLECQPGGYLAPVRLVGKALYVSCR